MNNRKLINIIKGDIQNAINNGNYTRNTEKNSNIEFDTKNKQILLDGVPYSNPLMVETTYNELKTLRDNSQLIPGSFYRITDYECTTTQENTKSAGHQFDIVLLALSENKLAEEGQAIMHDNIYDVTFTDGVTKKCYIYFEGTDYYIIDIITMLGYWGVITDNDLEVNEQLKTAISDNSSSILTDENFPYNYFQNSKLEAWKVWYCLDNDKTRFAWAKDYVNPADNQRMLMSKKANSDWGNAVYVRYPQGDCEKGIAWAYYDLDYDGTQNYQSVIDDGGTYVEPDLLAFTNNENPKAGDIGELWQFSPSVQKRYDVEITDVSWGTGVIYRLIDEWNNDCPYDFKNILHLRTMTSGEYDEDGVDTFVYTLGLCNTEGLYVDASIEGNVLTNPDEFVEGVFCNKIGTATAQSIEYDKYINEPLCFIIPDVVFTSAGGNEEYNGIYRIECGNNCSGITVRGSNIYISDSCSNISIVCGKDINIDYSNDITLGSVNDINIYKAYAINIGRGCSNINIGPNSDHITIPKSCRSVTLVGNTRFFEILRDYCYNIFVHSGVTGINLSSINATSIGNHLNNVIIEPYYQDRQSPITLNVTLNNNYTTRFKSSNSVDIDIDA